MIRIAIIGSTGTNFYKIIGDNPLNFLEQLKNLIYLYNMEISSMGFIGATSPLSNKYKSLKGRVFLWDYDNKVIVKQNLKDLDILNSEVNEVDKIIARKIRNNEINTLISLSSDVLGINKHSIEASIEKNIPIIASGEKSTGIISNMTKNIIKLDKIEDINTALSVISKPDDYYNIC